MWLYCVNKYSEYKIVLLFTFCSPVDTMASSEDDDDEEESSSEETKLLGSQKLMRKWSDPLVF